MRHIMRFMTKAFLDDYYRFGYDYKAPESYLGLRDLLGVGFLSITLDMKDISHNYDILALKKHLSSKKV